MVILVTLGEVSALLVLSLNWLVAKTWSVIHVLGKRVRIASSVKGLGGGSSKGNFLSFQVARAFVWKLELKSKEE